MKEALLAPQTAMRHHSQRGPEAQGQTEGASRFRGTQRERGLNFLSRRRRSGDRSPLLILRVSSAFPRIVQIAEFALVLPQPDNFTICTAVDYARKEERRVTPARPPSDRDPWVGRFPGPESSCYVDDGTREAI